MTEGLYIPVHTSLNGSRKLRRLMRELSISKAEAVGVLALFWLAVVEQAPDGRLDDWSNEDIASAAEWPEDKADDLVSALLESGFLREGEDDSMWVHDWEDYAGKTLTRRVRKTQQKREQRQRRSTHVATLSPDVAATNSDIEATSPPCRELSPNVANEPDQTRPDQNPSLQRGAGEGAPPAATRTPVGSKSKKPKAEAPTLQELLEMPYQGMATAREFFAQEFVGFDGKNGRLSLEAKYALMGAWLSSAPAKKRWKSPVGIHSWLSRDYPAARGAYERDRLRAAGQAPWQAPGPTPEEQARADEARRKSIERQQARLAVPIAPEDIEEGKSVLAALKGKLGVRSVVVEPKPDSTPQPRDLSRAASLLKAQTQ